MEIRTVARKLIKEVEYDGRREIRMFDGTFRMALINEMREDFSDEEIEDFLEEVKEDFIEIANKKGWRTEVEDGILIRKEEKWTK